MKMLSVLLSVFAFGAISFAQSGQSEQQAVLQRSGFAIVEDSDLLMKIKFRDENPFIISKSRYATSAAASSFCESQKLALDTNGIEKVMLLAMSGAATGNANIKALITFELKQDQDVVVSGVWAWSKLSDEVIALIDGRGTGSVILPIADIRKAYESVGQIEKAQLPAICK